MRTRILIPLRAAVMILVLGLGLPVHAEDIVVTKEMKAAVRLQEAATQEDIDDFKAIGIFCAIKNRGLQNDRTFRPFYENFKEDFKNVDCGKFGAK